MMCLSDELLRDLLKWLNKNLKRDEIENKEETKDD